MKYFICRLLDYEGKQFKPWLEKRILVKMQFYIELLLASLHIYLVFQVPALGQFRVYYGK